MNTTMKKIIATTGALALAVSLAGCGSDNSNEQGDQSGATITLGFLPSWTDGLSTAYLLEDQLEKMGYNVEMETLSEAAVLYSALAQGDVDVYPSAWSEVTHAAYMDQYGDKLEDLGSYYESAVLTFAVPEYTDIDSIDQLVGNSERFGGRIVGIEPGAGHMSITQDSVFPAYGLDAEYELVTSSTTAMLAELQSATEREEDIVVTLWRPFWANSAYPVKDLKDPKGALGATEALHFLARGGLSDDYPEIAEYIRGIQMTDEQYNQLEDLVVNEYGEGREAEAIDAWIEQNPDAYPGLLP